MLDDLVLWQGGLVADVLGIELLGGEGNQDSGNLALDIEGLLALDALVGVLNGLGIDLGGLVKASNTALDDLGDVDGVEDGSTHARDLNGLLLGLALFALQESDGVADVAALPSLSGDADVVLRALTLLLGSGLGADTAVLLAVNVLSGHSVCSDKKIEQ